ncbi:DUF6159 family protein [Aporhodopirellula aestuarii]|uniref:DUF6159 family protein n=1 Tax=Aporhodopirellula aestuarii TaxID=2950107 RepID=A0ABT0UCP7_9BACT|nr:DUF6159 family protein [Aporhodopirellula aestuarii]MCM2374787.1 DUF6159 family protein [Aporhodopirellula aestuarii]
MFERFTNGFHLARQSWEVLKTDKHLLLFPLLSGVSCLIVMATFAVPLLMSGVIEQAMQGADGEVVADDPVTNALMWGGLFLFYFVNYFVIVFFNSALIACAVKRFYGERPTISEGLSASMARLPQIAGWALVSATVGVALRAIESRSGRLGEFIVGLLGMAWSAVTFFVVPVLVIEKVGPITAVKRSTEILKSSWGEALAGNSSIGFFCFLAMLPCIGLIIGGGVVAGNGMALLGAALALIGVLGILLVSLISSALSAIIQAAVYMYGASGTAPSGFESSTLRSAFAHR